MAYKPGFMAYQVCRTFISTYKSGTTYEQEIKDLISSGMAKLTDAQWVGIRREHRAYGWMVKKYPSRWVVVSTKEQDQIGIDLYTKLKEPRVSAGKYPFYDCKYFAVSGPADKEYKERCDYKIVVSERKIGLQKSLKQKHN